MTKDELQWLKRFIAIEETKDINLLVSKLTMAVTKSLGYAYDETCNEIRQIFSICSTTVSDLFTKFLTEECEARQIDAKKLLEDVKLETDNVKK